MTHTYYCGDPCYVMTDDEWNTVCATVATRSEMLADYEDEGYHDCENYLDPDNFNWDDYAAARPYYVFSTRYGDGQYNDKEGNPYSVDSGLLCAIRTDFITAKDKLEHALINGLGHLHEFDEDFCDGGCGYDDGVIFFGTVEIDTN